MHVLVAGAGAIGGLLGARLQSVDHRVTLWTRGEQAEAIHRNGLRIVGSLELVSHPEVVTEIRRGASYDLILFTVKAYDVREAGAILAEHLPPAPLLALQNGLGVEDQLRDTMGRGGWASAADWILRGINTLPAMRTQPGVIRQAGEGEIILRDPSERSRADSRTFEKLFLSAHIPVRFTTDLTREIWRKALVNAAINPVTADHRLPNGALLRDPWRGQALALLNEARAVAAQEGMAFTSEEAEADLFRVVRATAENHSSMLQDVERGRRTEIEAISGEILRRGRLAGLSLPATERIVGRFRPSSKTS
ncbi:MAG: 2-dehydropantoate 2-reductase [Thermoplasmata archaeon]